MGIKPVGQCISNAVVLRFVEGRENLLVEGIVTPPSCPSMYIMNVPPLFQEEPLDEYDNSKTSSKDR